MMLENYFNEQAAEKSGNIKIEFKPGSKIRGTIVAIDKKSVFLDINSKSEGIINREEFVDNTGNITVHVGDKIDAYFVSDKGGEIVLTVKMSGKFVTEHLEDAYRNGIPIEGKVIEERKGGYLVKISGKDAFCPYSQIDLFPKAPSNYIGNSYSFTITEMNKVNTVLSRRKLLEKEKLKRLEYLRENLREGDLINGIVINVKDFGVFVDLDGCEGFIPVSELTWGRIEDPSEVLKPEDSVKVAVKKLDWENGKITLSYRSVKTPWNDVAEKYQRGKFLGGKVTRLTNFGVFVELEKGLEGLLHISQLKESGNSANLSLKILDKQYPIGSTINVAIREITSDRKISLALAERGESAEQTEWKDFKKAKSESPFGTSLADAFNKLDI